METFYVLAVLGGEPVRRTIWLTLSSLNHDHELVP